jgi:nitrogen fixation/metabolism regulation signal transduction histidine kinase
MSEYLDGLAERVVATERANPDAINRSIDTAMREAADSLDHLEYGKDRHRGPFNIEVPETALIWLTVAAMKATGYGEGGTDDD